MAVDKTGNVNLPTLLFAFNNFRNYIIWGDFYIDSLTAFWLTHSLNNEVLSIFC